MATVKKMIEGLNAECIKEMIPIKDALAVLEGKWKLPIILSLLYGKKRFKESLERCSRHN
jgi:DNA-binding HxlR family transcriptional regulator